MTDISAFHNTLLAQHDAAADAADQRQAFITDHALSACARGSSDLVTLEPSDLGDIDWHGNTASLWVRLTIQLPQPD